LIEEDWWLQPIAHWKFDEGDGNTAYDSAGNNHGILIGDPTWGEGQISGALGFDGADDYVEVGDSPKLEGMDNLTICAWIRPQQNAGQDNVVIVDKVCYTAYRFHIYDVDQADGTGRLTSWINGNTCSPTPNVELEMSGSSWYHVVLVYDNNDNEVRYYVDGSLGGTKALASGAIGTNSAPLWIARGNHPSPHYFTGIIDDVRLYDRVLSAEEVWQLYHEGLGAKAFDPDPPDAAVNVDPNAFLSWKPGKDAISHDVYFGTDFNDVNDANTGSGAFMGNQDTNSWDPNNYDSNGLDLETTYFWRIDERNVSGVTKGDVWSFTTYLDPNIMGHWKFDEGDGSTAYDSTGNNHGAIYGAQWTGGQIDGALGFDGADDYVEVGDSPKLEGMDNLTMCVWIRPQQNPGQGNVIIVDKECYTAYRFHIYDVDQADGNGLLTSWINGETCGPTPDVELEMSGSIWYHLVLVYDNNDNEVRYYVDGSLAGTKPLVSGAIGTNSAPLRIGRSNHPSPQYFKGIIDDVRVYDRALSTEEIWQLYQQGL
jgi:hypothetical protein